VRKQHAPECPCNTPCGSLLVAGRGAQYTHQLLLPLLLLLLLLLLCLTCGMRFWPQGSAGLFQFLVPAVGECSQQWGVGW
jgi:hypothetical protein